MHRKLEQSKFLIVLMTLLLVLNTLTPITQVLAAEINLKNSWIKSASISKLDDPNDSIDAKISLITEGDQENSIVFDLSDRYESEDEFIGINYGVSLELNEDVKVYNEAGKEIGGAAGYQGVFEEANKPYLITFKNKDEEEIDVIVLIKTKDYDPQVKVTGFTKFTPLSVEAQSDPEELKSSLPSEVELVLSNKTKRSVAVEWDVKSLDLSEAGSKKLTGNYALPEGVIGEKLEVYIEIEVTETETIKQELEALIKKAENLKADEYTEESYEVLLDAISASKSALNSDETVMEEAYEELNNALKNLVYQDENFEFNKDTKTITKYIGKSSNVIVPEEIEGVSVEHIGREAFTNSSVSNKEVTKVVLPSTLVSIEEKAFFRVNLEEIIFNDGLLEIGAEAFKHNELTQVNLPNSVIKVHESAFANNKLTQVSLGKVEQIDKQAFMNNRIETVKLPESLGKIGVNAFANNELTELNVPRNLKVLNGFGNNNLTEIAIPETIEAIGQSAFASNKLTDLQLPESVTHIDAHAFDNNNLQAIKFGEKIEKIGRQAFENNNLVDLYIPASIKEIDAAAFSKNRITNQTAKINSKKASVRLGNKAFDNAKPIFIKDVEASLKFDTFELHSTEANERLVLAQTNKDKLEFLAQGKSREDAVKALKDKTAVYKFKVAEGIEVYSNGEQVMSDEIDIKTIENQNVTLKSYGIEKEYLIDLNSIYLDLFEFKEALTKAEQMLATDFLTESSKERLKKAYEEASALLKQSDKTNDQVIQATNALKAATEDAKVTLVINDLGQVTAYNGTHETIVIPENWNGVQVKEIKANVFKNKQIKELVLPESLEVIGASAFENNEIRKITFAQNKLTDALTKYGMSSKQSLVIEKNVFNNNELTELMLPYGVKNIGDQAFANNKFDKFSIQIDNYESKVLLGENVFGGVAPTFLRTDYLSVDKDYLDELISRGDGITQDYTPESYEAYQSAFEKAKQVSESPSSQEEVTQASQELELAINNLVPTKDIEEESLKRLITQIEELDPLELSSEAYNKALIEIKEIDSKESLSQEDINNGYQVLNGLLKQIETNPKLFGYKVINEYEVSLTDYRGDSGTLVIPSLIDGKKVTRVEAHAFSNLSLNNLILPESIHTIGEHAFESNALTSVTLPPYLKTLGKAAFKSNHLTEVFIPTPRLKEISEEAFYRNAQLEKVLLSEGLERISRQAFADAEIKEIELPKSLVEIAALAFASNHLTELSIHENVTEIGDFSFQDNRIEEGKATINNVEQNVEEGKAILGNNPNKDSSISLKYIGEEILKVIVPELEVLEVKTGTTEEEVLELLPKQVNLEVDRQIKTRTLNELTVDVIWSSENYEAVEGTYTFEASYELPQEFTDKPELQVVVEVLPEENDNKVLKDALADAQAVNEDENATVEEVKEAIERLEALLNPIQLDKAKQELEALIEKAKQVDLTNKTPASIEALERIIDEAEALLTSPDPSKEALSVMIFDLTTALDNLMDQADKTLLSKKIQAAKELDTSNKTSATVDALEKAIEKAEEINREENASQAEVEAALDSLVNAIEGLKDRIFVQSVELPDTIEVNYGTSESDLPLPIELIFTLTNDEKLPIKVEWKLETPKTFDGTEPGDYIFEGNYALPEEVEGDKPSVDLMVTVLDKDVDKSALEALVKQAKEKDLSSKTEESLKALKKEIKASEEVLLNENVSQAEVDAQVKALKEALTKLVEEEDQPGDGGEPGDDGEPGEGSTPPSDDGDLGEGSTSSSDDGDLGEGSTSPSDDGDLGEGSTSPSDDRDPGDKSTQLTGASETGDGVTSLEKKTDGSSEGKTENQKEKLPKTATAIFNTVALGIILIMLGLIFIRSRKFN